MGIWSESGAIGRGIMAEEVRSHLELGMADASIQHMEVLDNIEPQVLKHKLRRKTSRCLALALSPKLGQSLSLGSNSGPIMRDGTCERLPHIGPAESWRWLYLDRQLHSVYTRPRSESRIPRWSPEQACRCSNTFVRPHESAVLYLTHVMLNMHGDE